MGVEDSLKKLKRKKNMKKKREEESSELAQEEGYFCRANTEDKKNNDKKKKKKSSVDIANKVDTKIAELPNIGADETHEISGGKTKSKKLRNNKRKKGKITRTEIKEVGNPDACEVEDRISGKEVGGNESADDKLQKSRRKKRKNVESVNNVNEENKDTSKRRNGKSKNLGKVKKKSQFLANESLPDNFIEKRGEDAEDEVYEMSSGDEDYSKGMKKWITQYHQSRPGLKLLQERIDDFIVAHETQEEQARAEREAQAAEGGWTVVVHHKGRKKTTDAESGVSVGSVAQAAVLDKMAKKKKKEIGVDFYRFQKREAHRNEIIMLQSKFEQDKKRIQQMRAARKFRPY